MVEKTESILDQNVLKEILYEFYQKGNSENQTMIAQKVVQEMIEKLLPFFKQKRP